MAAAAATRLTQAFAGTTRMAAQQAARAAAVADSVVHVSCTMNNVHVTVSDLEGQVVARASGGMLGHKHRARATPQAASEVAQQAAAKAVAAGHQAAHVQLKGPSRGRGQILRGIMGAGMRVLDIRDVTPIPTNGCRPPHARRL